MVWPGALASSRPASVCVSAPLDGPPDGAVSGSDGSVLPPYRQLNSSCANTRIR